MRITIVVPAHNEEAILKKNILKLYAFCVKQFHVYQWKIIIAENGSNDKTNIIGSTLAKNLNQVDLVHIDKAGKGRAILSVWQNEKPDIGIFIDADLAPKLDILPLLIKEIEKGADIAIGSRMLPKSKIERTFKRSIFSHANRKLRELLFLTKIKDTACGVKAVNKKTIINLVPNIQNQKWFFDSELLIRAEKLGYHIAELPVVWRDRKQIEGSSKLHILQTSKEYIEEMIKLKRELKNWSK